MSKYYGKCPICRKHDIESRTVNFTNLGDGFTESAILEKTHRELSITEKGEWLVDACRQKDGLFFERHVCVEYYKDERAYDGAISA